MIFLYSCLVGVLVLVLVLVGVLVYRAPDASRRVGKANRMFLFLHAGELLGACLGEQQKRLGNN